MCIFGAYAKNKHGRLFRNAKSTNTSSIAARCCKSRTPHRCINPPYFSDLQKAANKTSSSKSNPHVNFALSLPFEPTIATDLERLCSEAFRDSVLRSLGEHPEIPKTSQDRDRGDFEKQFVSKHQIHINTQSTNIIHTS